MTHNEKQNQLVDIQIYKFIECRVYDDITLAWMASPCTQHMSMQFSKINFFSMLHVNIDFKTFILKIFIFVNLCNNIGL